MGAEVEGGEVIAVGVAAGFADFALVAEGEGEEDGVAFGCDGDAWSDFSNVARACVGGDIMVSFALLFLLSFFFLTLDDISSSREESKGLPTFVT